MKTLCRFGFCLALILAGCAASPPTAFPHFDQENTVTLSAGQKVVLALGQRARVPSGVETWMTNPGAGMMTITGHGGGADVRPGTTVSVPANATGPADNLIVAVQTPKAPPAAPLSASALNGRNHWQRFLKLANRPEAVMTFEDVEGNFGEKAVHRAGTGYDLYTMAGIGQLIPHRDPANAPHDPHPVFTDLGFSFDDRQPATCIKTDQVISDLQKAGW